MQDIDSTTQKLTKRFARRLRRFSELSILGLKEKQVYPPYFLRSEEYILPEPYLLIDKATPVGSMGSCFAREIKEYLEKNDYNYVSKGGGAHGSAPWERVFNSACIKQEIKRAFGKFEVSFLHFPDGRVADPFRKKTIFKALDEAECECSSYVSAARSALLDSKVFIITLGLSEVWYDKHTGHTFAEAPPNELFDASRHAYRLLEPEENYQNIREALEILKNENQEIEIIVTVSPIPLRTTFFDRSAIVSNNVSKASLVFAAHKITQEFSYVHYFPSYEITSHLIDEPFEWDGRHIKRETVQGIMNAFEKVFCGSEVKAVHSTK